MTGYLQAVSTMTWAGCKDIKLVTKVAIILGRGSRTTVQDIRCSRNALAVQLEEDGTITVTQMGKNPCSVDGAETKPDIIYKAGDKSTICLLPNSYCFRVSIQEQEQPKSNIKIPEHVEDSSSETTVLYDHKQDVCDKCDSLSPKRYKVEVKDRHKLSTEEPFISSFRLLPKTFQKGDVAVLLPHGWHCFKDSVLCVDFKEPIPSAKIAGFDFDGCLATTPLHGFDPNAWKLRFSNVGDTLKILVHRGYKVVIFTNENIERFKRQDAINKVIKKKIGRLTGFLRKVEVSAQVFCFLRKDKYRKPSPAIWNELGNYFNGSIVIDKQKSFYVGDAAGRPHDHGADDRLFAENIGVRFMTEQEFFTQHVYLEME